MQVIKQESPSIARINSLAEILDRSSGSPSDVSAAAAASGLSDRANQLACEVAVMFSVSHLNIVQARACVQVHLL